MNLSQFNPQSFRGRMALSLGAILVYIAMFFSLHPSLGLGVAPLSLIPVAVMAWLFGLRGGLVAGLLITGVNILLIFLLEDTLLSSGFVFGSIVIVITGGFIGQIHDLGERVKQELIRRKQAEIEREHVIDELREALAKVKTLSGLLPICSSCKKIRNDQGYWQQVEDYISHHSEADFTHGICPDCLKTLYPEYYGDEDLNRDE